MTGADILLILLVGMVVGRASTYRTIRGQQDELEMCRQHVDATEPVYKAGVIKGRIAHSAIQRSRRLRERT